MASAGLWKMLLAAGAGLLLVAFVLGINLKKMRIKNNIFFSFRMDRLWCTGLARISTL
jgi:hypothetical protein